MGQHLQRCNCGLQYGGFTVKVLNDLKSSGNGNSGKTVVRLNMDNLCTPPGLEKKYWIMKDDGQMLTVKDVDAEVWITQTGDPVPYYKTTDAVVAPGQGFFVQSATGFDGNVTMSCAHHAAMLVTQGQRADSSAWPA